MLKHLGVCRAAGGEKPPKSEGGGSERQRAGRLLRDLFWFTKVFLMPLCYHVGISLMFLPINNMEEKWF